VLREKIKVAEAFPNFIMEKALEKATAVSVSPSRIGQVNSASKKRVSKTAQEELALWRE
jgi:hypothetical protein